MQHSAGTDAFDLMALAVCAVAIVLVIAVAVGSSRKMRGKDEREPFFADARTGAQVGLLQCTKERDRFSTLCDMPLMVDGKLDVPKRLHFGDSSMSTRPNGPNGSDPYWFEKVTNGRNNSALRLTINDDPDESFQIWGNSCRTTGCHGTGRLQHYFTGNGHAGHRGKVYVGGDLDVRGHANVQGRLHFRDPRMTERYNWGSNNSDSYYLEKKEHGRNRSSLDLTINDDRGEKFRIMGNSCREGPRGCSGPGVQQHMFRANGDYWNRGRLFNDRRGHAYLRGGVDVGHRRHRKRLDIWHPTGNTHFPWRNGHNYIRGRSLRVDCGLRAGGRTRAYQGVQAPDYAFRNTEEDRRYPHHLVNYNQTVLRWDRNNTGRKARTFVRGGNHGRNATFYYKDPDNGRFRYLLDTGNMHDLAGQFQSVQADKFRFRDRNNHRGDKSGLEYNGNGGVDMYTDYLFDIMESDNNRRAFRFDANRNKFCIGNTCISDDDMRKLRELRSKFT